MRIQMRGVVRREVDEVSRVDYFFSGLKHVQLNIGIYSILNLVRLLFQISDLLGYFYISWQLVVNPDKLTT